MKFIKNNLRVVIAVALSFILIIAGMIFLALEKEEDTPNNEIGQEEKLEQITEITGMSGNDAIEIVKANFYSNNYEFKVEVTNDSLYKVTAISSIDNSKTIYYVDPTNKMAYADIDTN